MPVAINGNGPITGLGPLAQCSLQLYSGSAFLFGYNGNQLYVGGANRTIPNSAIALSPGGLIANTTYYVYAYMNGATMTLEASTTGKLWDSNTGLYFKNGDLSRTLVGMVRPIVGPAFVDSLTQRFVVSWFNRREIVMQASLTADANLTFTTGTLAATANLARLEFLCWDEEHPSASMMVQVQHASANGVVYGGLGLNSTTTTMIGTPIYQAYTATSNGYLSNYVGFAAPEGYNYISLNSMVGSGSGKISAGGVIQAKVRI